jgi:hypothetical protein
MEVQELEELYQIDSKRLINYYERIEKQSHNKDTAEVVAKFLNNQSVGPVKADLIDILNYYREKLVNEKTLLDFALEMIRANKIRLEYKKYLSQATHKNLELAIDDCIFLFFLEYDKYIRNLFLDEIKEFEISSLYDVFFRPPEINGSQNIYDILEDYKMKVPTVFHGNKRINTNIITLRSGLSEIITEDYKKLKKSKNKDFSHKPHIAKSAKPSKKEEKADFRGSLIERMVKSYCISKSEIAPREVENAISQFLSSYFKFGTFYEYQQFKELMIKSFAEDIYLGLTEKVKASYSLDYLEEIISLVLQDFELENKDVSLDGSAWRDDLKPILKKFLIDFIKNIFAN